MALKRQVYFGVENNEVLCIVHNYTLHEYFKSVVVWKAEGERAVDNRQVFPTHWFLLWMSARARAGPGWSLVLTPSLPWVWPELRYLSHPPTVSPRMAVGRKLELEVEQPLEGLQVSWQWLSCCIKLSTSPLTFWRPIARMGFTFFFFLYQDKAVFEFHFAGIWEVYLCLFLFSLYYILFTHPQAVAVSSFQTSRFEMNGGFQCLDF